MARFQILDRPKLLASIGPVTLAADNTPAAIEVTDFANVELMLGVGVGGITFDGTNKLELKLRHGGSTVGAHAAVAAKDVRIFNAAGALQTLGADGIVWSFTAAHAAAAFRRIDYVGDQSHISLLADFSGTHGTGTPITLAVWGSRGRTNPPI